MIFFEPHSRDRALFPHDPFKALVTPRPIGWISTLSAKGELNLAPYSSVSYTHLTLPTILLV